MVIDILRLRIKAPSVAEADAPGNRELMGILRDRHVAVGS
jgi:hypothetical protein